MINTLDKKDYYRDVDKSKIDLSELDRKEYFKDVKNFAVCQIPFTQRHCMWIEFSRTKANSKDIYDIVREKQVYLASIMNPGSRCHDVFGDHGQLIDNAIFLSDDLMLVNF